MKFLTLINNAVLNINVVVQYSLIDNLMNRYLLAFHFFNLNTMRKKANQGHTFSTTFNKTGAQASANFGVSGTSIPNKQIGWLLSMSDEDKTNALLSRIERYTCLGNVVAVIVATQDQIKSINMIAVLEVFWSLLDLCISLHDVHNGSATIPIFVNSLQFADYSLIRGSE